MPEQAAAAQQEARYYGKYRGMVKNNEDNMKMGRLEVIVPQVFREAKVWALPCVPYAGKDVGFFAMPEKGTCVWIEFEAGDPSFPIWTGCSWAEGDIASSDAKPNVKFLKTKHFTLRIDDDKKEVVIEDKNGASITLRPGPQGVSIKAAKVDVETNAGASVRLAARAVSCNDIFVVS